MKISSHSTVIMLAGVLTLLGLLSLDPYSFGHMGGEYRLFRPGGGTAPLYPWQQWLTLLLVVLLLLATSQHLRGYQGIALSLLCVEAALFLGLNVLYVYRDGLMMRALVGDEGSRVPAVVTVVGILCRLVIIWNEWRGSKRFSRVRDSLPRPSS